MSLLEIKNLNLAMTSYEGEAHILHGISLKIERGEIWGMVGETGSGKSLTGLSISRLIPSPLVDISPGRSSSRDGTCSRSLIERSAACAGGASE